MKYIVLGLGAIGSNLMMQLTKIDPKGEFVGVDFDNVEERNLNTQAYLLPHIGMPKVNALQVILAMKTRGIRYRGIHDKITTPIKEWVQSDTLIIDCFDNTESRRLFETFDNCLHIGFSPKYTAEIIWGKYSAPGAVPKGEDDICEMPYAVPFINFVVSVACLSIKNFLDTQKRNSYIILDKFKIRSL
jgi:hypothetical protein